MKKLVYVPPRRIVDLWMVAFLGSLLIMGIMLFHIVTYHYRINRAIELLSGDNDEVVKPARLYAILSGEHFVPVTKHELESDVTPEMPPHGGVPLRQ